MTKYVKLSSTASEIAFGDPANRNQVVSVKNQITRPSSTGLRYVRANVRTEDTKGYKVNGKDVPGQTTVNISLSTPFGQNTDGLAEVEKQVLLAVGTFFTRLKADASLAEGFLTEAQPVAATNVQ